VQVLKLIVEAAVEISFKTQHYALVIGLIQTEKPEFAGRVVARVISEAEAALATRNNFRAKQLLRFLAALAAVSVVTGEWLLSALGAIVDVALGTAQSGTLEALVTWQEQG
jgi:nuclear cap-binding protein subunit 1